MIIFGIYPEGILSKTASYLMTLMQNAWSGSGETRLTEYGNLFEMEMTTRYIDMNTAYKLEYHGNSDMACTYNRIRLIVQP